MGHPRARLSWTLAWALALALRLSAQPVIPDSRTLEGLRTLEEVNRSFRADVVTPAPAPLSVTLTTRAQARAFFNAVYAASENIPSGWTGSLSGTPGTGPVTGTPGATSAAFQAAVQLRINWFRAMAGIPAAIAFDSAEGAMDQQAALIMSANNYLSHTPPTTWLLYTSDGATAAGQSNLSLGEDGPDAIDGYILDYGGINDVGTSNGAVGHRRWLLYPQTQTMATGDVDATGSFLAANATWILDGNYGGPRPSTRDGFVAWPPPGYVPYQVVFPRWSLSYPGADFSSATVTMTSNGAPVPVSLEALDNPAYGENTIVWDYNGLDGDTDFSAAPQPSADTAYTVAVDGVNVGGTLMNFSYTVTVFDPAVAGTGDAPPTLSGPSQPPVGEGSTYTVAGLPSFANGFEYRTVAVGNAPGSFSASGGLQGIVASVSAGYNDVSSSGYYLAMPAAVSQTLTLPGEYLASSSSSLQFESELGYATSDQVARVQISLDDGNTWSDVYTQPGTGTAGETSFVSRTVSLSAYAGYPLEIRFAYTYDAVNGGSLYYETSPGVGWSLNAISFTGVSTAAPGAPSAFEAGNSFSYTPPAAGAVALEARPVLFGNYPLPWGPLLGVTAAAPTGRLVNISTRAQVGTGGNILIPGFVIGGTGMETLLIRADGPALTPFGVAGALAEPSLSVYSGSTLVASNTGWGTGTNASQIASTAAAVGAFALPSGSADCALIVSLPPGSYTVQVSGVGNTTGIALAEVYEVSSSGTRLVNLSTRAQVGTGANLLIPGFVISGAGTEQLLVRGDGPSLTAFGVAGALAQPSVSLLNNAGAVIASNTGWGTNTNASQIASTAVLVGAFALASGSADSALIANLPAGAYTIQVSGVDNTDGVALAEIYEVP